MMRQLRNILPLFLGYACLSWILISVFQPWVPAPKEGTNDGNYKFYSVTATVLVLSFKVTPQAQLLNYCLFAIVYAKNRSHVVVPTNDNKYPNIRWVHSRIHCSLPHIVYIAGMNAPMICVVGKTRIVLNTLKNNCVVHPDPAPEGGLGLPIHKSDVPRTSCRMSMVGTLFKTHLKCLSVSIPLGKLDIAVS